MRQILKEIGEEKRNTYTGTFSRFGEKKAFKGPVPDITVLLTNIKDVNGNTVTDHAWFNYTKGFKACNLKEGDVVQFDARVKEYEKGYKGHRDIELQFFHPVCIDYKFSHPSKVKVINRKVENMADNEFD